MNNMIGRALHHYVTTHAFDEETTRKMRLIWVGEDIAIVSFGGLMKTAARDQFVTTAVPEFVRVEPAEVNGYPAVIIQVRSMTN